MCSSEHEGIFGADFICTVLYKADEESINMAYFYEEELTRWRALKIALHMLKKK